MIHARSVDVTGDAMPIEIDPRKVFLVAGQEAEQKVGGREGISPVVTQHVVIAEDPLTALQALAESVPTFNPLGHVSLADYEAAAARLRAVAEGRSSEWPILVA